MLMRFTWSVIYIYPSQTPHGQGQTIRAGWDLYYKQDFIKDRYLPQGKRAYKYSNKTLMHVTLSGCCKLGKFPFLVVFKSPPLERIS